MFVRTMMRRAALTAAAPLLLALSLPAHERGRPAETDAPPTEADQRFRTKYGIWPPHITAEKRAERERARTADRTDQSRPKKEKSSAKAEGDRQ